MLPEKLWWPATALTLAAGYALLERGETVVAPTLLVIGYVVLAPCAIRLGYNRRAVDR